MDAAAAVPQEFPVTWHTYPYIWPLLDRLAELDEAARLRLTVADSPLDPWPHELVILETVKVPVSYVATLERLVPTRCHVVSLAFLQETEGFDEQAFIGARKIFMQESVKGGDRKPGKRFLTYLLAVTNPEVQKLYDDAVVEYRSRKQPDPAVILDPEVVSYVQWFGDLGRRFEIIQNARLMRACWLARR